VVQWLAVCTHRRVVLLESTREVRILRPQSSRPVSTVGVVCSASNYFCACTQFESQDGGNEISDCVRAKSGQDCKGTLRGLSGAKIYGAPYDQRPSFYGGP